MVFQSKTPRQFKSHCGLPVLLVPFTGYYIALGMSLSVCLHFLICKMGLIEVSLLKGYWED